MAKILIVDDEEAIRIVLATLFRTSGHQVIEAIDGEEGVQAAISFTPELIISDVTMPKMDGMELANILSTNPGTSRIPIILLSANRVDTVSQRKGLAMGAREYFLKPFETSELILAAERLLQEAELRRDMPWA